MKKSLPNASILNVDITAMSKLFMARQEQEIKGSEFSIEVLKNKA